MEEKAAQSASLNGMPEMTFVFVVSSARQKVIARTNKYAPTVYRHKNIAFFFFFIQLLKLSYAKWYVVRNAIVIKQQPRQ